MRKQQQIRTRHRAAKSRLAAFLLAATAFGGGLSAFATTYTWTGGGTANNDGSYNWNDTDNWSVPTSDTDNTPMEPTAAPTASDSVVIGSAVTITGANSNFGTLTLNANVTLTGSFYPGNNTISGAENVVLTLKNFSFKNSNNSAASFTLPIVASGSVYNEANSTIVFSGASVSGDSNASFTSRTNDNYAGYNFNGCDLTGFAGTITGCSRNNGNRDYTVITPPADTTIVGGSASAKWSLGYRDNNGTSVLKTGSRTYSFGALNSHASGFSLKGLSDVTMNIGARDSDTSTLAINSAYVGTRTTINKVGSNVLYLAAAIATLNVNAGTVTLTDSANVPAAIAMADGTTLGFADDAEFATSFITPAGAATIDVAAGKSVTLADSFAALTKTGDGVLALATAPSGTITVMAGYVYLPAESTPTLGTDTGSISTSAGLMIFNTSAVNVWTGAAEDNTWATAGNWSKGAAPVSTDVVIIPEGDDLEIETAGSSDFTGILTIKRNVTLTGAEKGITLSSVSGSGTLTLDAGSDKTFFLYAGTPFTINCDLCIENKVLNNTSSVLTVNGAFSGSGEFSHQKKSDQPGVKFYGDTSAFTGSYTGGPRDNGDRDSTAFYGDARGSEDAYWHIGYEGAKGSYPFQVSNTTYYFGQLETRWYKGNSVYQEDRLRFQPATGSTMVVGNLAGQTSYVSGKLVSDSNTLRKVGDTSIVNLKLFGTEGAVEVEAGTLNFQAADSDSAYAPTSCTITGTGATVVVPDAVANSTLTIVEDDPETEEDESSTTGTAFAPVLSAELQAAYCELKAVEGDGVTTYSLYDIAQVGEATYKTIADAVAAATGDNKAITVIRTTQEPVVLATPGQTLTCAENVTCGAVSVVAGLVLEEENGVYTAADNTTSTWTNGGGDNKWGTAANWSSGYVPDAATVVTLPDGATIYTVASGTAGYCGGMVVNGAVTISYNANMDSYTAIQCNGDITGEGTLTLARAGINGNNKAVTISADLAIENNAAAYATSGNDSWLENGTFTIDGDVTVSGLFRTYASTTFNGAVSIVDGGTITSYGGSAPTFNGAVTLTGQSGIYTYAVTYNGAVTMGDDAVISVGSSSQTFGGGFVLNGSGTWIGDTQLPGSAVQTCLRNNKSNVWTGVCELYNLTVSNNLTPDSYANNNSTVRFKGVTTGCLKAGTYSCGIELAGNGLTISGDYSRTVTFSGKFFGSGALKVGTVGSNGFDLYITGDYSGFTGGVQFTNASNRYRRVVFGASSTTSTGSCVVIAQGASLTVDSGAVWGPTNLVVLGEITFNGTLNIPAGGIWGSGNTGNRTIRFNDLSKAPNCAMFAGSWNGTCVLGDPAADGTEIKLYNFGNANSTIELAGVTAGYIGINGNTNVTSKVVLSGNVKLTNGWPTGVQSEGSMPTTRLTTLASLGGEGDLELNYTGTSSSWSSSSKAHIVVNKLDGAYEGDISIGNYWLLEVDAVDFAAAPTTAGSALIGLTIAENGTLYNAAHNAVTASNGRAIDVTVAGVASTEKLVLGADGLYLAVASVDGAYYATLQAAVDAAGENTVTLLADGQSAVLAGGSSVKIAKGGYSCTITAGEGYTLSDATEEGVTTYTTTLQYAAKIGSTYYDTVDEALPSLMNNRDAVVEVLDSTYTVDPIFAQQLLAAGIIWDSDARTFAWAVVKDGNNLYASVAAAITGGATSITLFKNVTENVVLPAGVSFSAGSYTLTGTVTAASGSLLGVKNGVYTAYASNTAEEWVGGVSGNEWTVADNWSLGFVPVATTPVTFTAGEHSVVVTGWGTAKCASMTVNGTLTFTQTLGETGNCYCLDINGNVSGTGKIVLSHAGIWNATSGSVTISVPIEVVATGNSEEVSRIGGVLNNGSDVGAIVLTGNLSVYSGARLQYEIDVQLNGGKLEVDGYMINKSGGYAKWLKVNGGTVNLNEGGELSICRFTAVGAMAINFNGGTLTEYGSGGNFDKIIGGQTDSWGDQGTITLTVKEKGLTVNTDANTTILPVLAGDGESTGGGLTKTGTGTLTLSASPTFTGAITVEGGSVVVPVAANVTLGGETYVSATTETTQTLSMHSAYSAAVDENTADVPYSWVKSNVTGFAGMTDDAIVAALAANSTTLQANGYNYFTCYALGLDPAVETDKPIVTLVANSDGTLTAMLVHPDGTEISAADTVTLTTTYTLYTSPTAASGTTLETPNAISVANAVDSTTGVGYIKATVSISAK